MVHFKGAQKREKDGFKLTKERTQDNKDNINYEGIKWTRT